MPATIVNVEGAGGSGGVLDWDVVAGVRYLGFSLAGRNGFVKVNETEGANELQVLGWGIETDVDVPIVATLESPVPESSTLVLLALGVAGLVTYRALRGRKSGV